MIFSWPPCCIGAFCALFYFTSILVSKKKGATEAAIRYHVSRKTAYKWMKRYDGSIESLKDRSRRPHHSPRQQTPTELKMVKRYSRQYKGDLLRGYQRAQQYGYTRSYGCFKRMAYKLEGTVKKKLTQKSSQRAPRPALCSHAQSAICMSSPSSPPLFRT